MNKICINNKKKKIKAPVKYKCFYQENSLYLYYFLMKCLKMLKSKTTIAGGPSLFISITSVIVWLKSK